MNLPDFMDVIRCPHYAHDCGGRGKDFVDNAIFVVLPTKSTAKALVPLSRVIGVFDPGDKSCGADGINEAFRSVDALRGVEFEKVGVCRAYLVADCK